MKPFTLAAAAVLLTLATVLAAAACLPSSSDAATTPTNTPFVYLLAGKDAGSAVTDADFQQLRQEAGQDQDQERERGKPGNSPKGTADFLACTAHYVEQVREAYLVVYAMESNNTLENVASNLVSHSLSSNKDELALLSMVMCADYAPRLDEPFTGACLKQVMAQADRQYPEYAEIGFPAGMVICMPRYK